MNNPPMQATPDEITELVAKLHGIADYLPMSPAEDLREAAAELTRLSADNAAKDAALDDKQLPFTVALALQNSHYRANGVAELTELEAFSEQYVKDARVAIETIRAALQSKG